MEQSKTGSRRQGLMKILVGLVSQPEILKKFLKDFHHFIFLLPSLHDLKQSQFNDLKRLKFKVPMPFLHDLKQSQFNDLKCPYAISP